MTSARKTSLLIDSATSGCAGAYVDGIRASIEDSAAVEVGVSYYFPYQYGKRIFYRYSELAAQKKYRLGRTRLYVRFAELLVAFVRLIVYIAWARIRVVCYALSSNLLLEYIFLWSVKHLARARLYVICHDVIPFVSPGEDYYEKIRKRRKFYLLADKLIVHNDNSVTELKEVFGMDEAKIERFPFPIYDLSRMGIRLLDVLPASTDRRFLFIGHLRTEKGVALLLHAWRQFAAGRTGVELVIAGNIPAGCSYDFESVSGLHVTLLPGYLTDEQYVNLIRQSHCVVLPYLRGTNSAVVSTVLSLGRNVIASDIEMFRNNALINEESFFRAGDAVSLAERLGYFAELSDGEQDALRAAMTDRMARYHIQFREQVNAVLGAKAVA